MEIVDAFHKPEYLEVREHVRDMDIETVRELARSFVTGLLGEEDADTMKSLVDEYYEAMDKDNTFTLMHGEKVIGISYLKHLGFNQETGQTLYLLASGTILPEYRYGGLYSRFRKKIFASLRRDDPGAILLSITNSPAILTLNHQSGFMRIHYYDLENFAMEDAMRLMAFNYEKKGYQLFLKKLT